MIARRGRLEAWIAGIRSESAEQIVDANASVCDRAGRMRATAEAIGRPADTLDCLIAASAVDAGLTLVTRNTRDFETFGLQIFNPWRE